MRYSLPLVVLLVLLGFTRADGAPATAPVTAPEPAQVAAPTTAPALEPAVKELLDQTRAAYEKLNTLDLAGTYALDIDAAGQSKQFAAEFAATYQSPNKLRHEMRDDVTVVSTGEKLFAHFLARNAFVGADAPKSRADRLPAPADELLREQNPSLYLAAQGGATDDYLAGASSVKRIADVNLADGTTCTTIEFAYPDRDVQWLISPTTHLLRQVRIDMRKSLAESNVPRVNRAAATIDYSKVQTDGPVDAAARFAWAAPAGATPLKPDAPELSGGGPSVAGAGGGEGPAAALVGKPAPNFKLADASGKSVSLSDLKGSVVVLDFWATWCGPCRGELPVLDKVAAARANDGVKTFAINLKEDPDKVGRFVDETKLGLNVLFDRDGKVSEKFLVDGIPQTVVIDRAGIVRHVSIGWGDGGEERLSAAIDAVLKK